MDIVLVLVLVVIALCMLLGKPLQITITHKVDRPPMPKPDDLNELQKQTEKDSDAILSMDRVIQSLQDIMGVNTDEQNDSRT